jgi:hypothetical protein
MKQKLPVLIALYLSACAACFSQKEPVVLINSHKEIDRSFFIAPEFKLSKVINDWQSFGGVRLGYGINHKYIFGIEVDGVVSDMGFYGPGSLTENDYLRNTLFYGGLYFDFIVPTGIPLQVSFPTLLGVGGDIVYEKQPFAKFLEVGDFKFAEPKLNLELNLLRFLRIGAGVGYRLVTNSHIQRLSNKDLSGIVINANIKFGSF